MRGAVLVWVDRLGASWGVFGGLWRVCGVVAIVCAFGVAVGGEALTVDGWRIGGCSRTSGGGGARGVPSVRVARGCTHPYKMRGGEMAVLPHLSVRMKKLDKLRGMWYNGGGGESREREREVEGE